MRRSISGNKVQTLNDRKNLFTKEPDPNLFHNGDKETSFRGKSLGGILPVQYGVLPEEKRDDNYMDLK